MIPFGKRGCVDGRALAGLGPRAQREGILLMRETGMTMADIILETGIDAADLSSLADGKTTPFKPDWSE